MYIEELVDFLNIEDEKGLSNTDYLCMTIAEKLYKIILEKDKILKEKNAEEYLGRVEENGNITYIKEVTGGYLSGQYYSDERVLNIEDLVEKELEKLCFITKDFEEKYFYEIGTIYIQLIEHILYIFHGEERYKKYFIRFEKYPIWVFGNRLE